MNRSRLIISWIILATIAVVPVLAAANSPLLAWRDPVYIAAGFAGVFALIVLFYQPLLAAGYLPGLPVPRGRLIHRWSGVALVMFVIVHVAGLWVTSPPDVIDALLFRSPTSFSLWGVIAMWCVFASATLVILRRHLRLRPELWRWCHRGLALVIVTGSIVHAVLIEGTMETFSKLGLCALVFFAAAATLVDFRKSK